MTGKHASGELLGAAGEVAVAGGAVAGRVLSQVVRVGAQVASRRVRWAVAGGRADARRREQELRRSIEGTGAGTGRWPSGR